jgi:hypothetical protein
MIMRINPHASDWTQSIADPPPQCRHALGLLLSHRGNPSAEIDRVLIDDPRCVFGHCLRATLIVLADDAAARSTLATSLAAIEGECPHSDAPARRHATAARAWLEGDPGLAAERYGAIVNDRPTDILALVVAHAFDFRFGRRQMLRDRIAQVLPAWDATARGYASVLAMHAFGLEENGQYNLAERAACRALAIDPGHPAAIHVIAHVLEMQGRTREGLQFLDATQSAWSEGTGFSVHLAWHKALFHLDSGDPAAALAVYDKQIARGRAADMNGLADGSALLWRLQLRNMDLGPRWQLLADGWERQSLVGVRPFYVAHAMMAFAAADRTRAAARLLEALPRAQSLGPSEKPPEEAFAEPFCRALLAFARADYAASVEWLTRVRHIADRCGGSLAQCDLIHLTFTEAALRARRAQLARALVSERSAQKPTSRLNQLLQQRLHAMSAAA